MITNKKSIKYQHANPSEFPVCDKSLSGKSQGRSPGQISSSPAAHTVFNVAMSGIEVGEDSWILAEKRLLIQ
jgi:hypothetical protein